MSSGTSYLFYLEQLYIYYTLKIDKNIDKMFNKANIYQTHFDIDYDSNSDQQLYSHTH